MEDLLQKLAQALGLPEGADEAAIFEKISTLLSASKPNAELHSRLTAALGLNSDASIETVIGAAQGAAPKGVVSELQSQLNDVTSRFNELQSTTARAAAEAFVDGAIKAGRVGVKPLRDHYIDMHMQDPERVAKEITAMPVLGAGELMTSAPTPSGGVTTELNSAQRKMADMLGVSHEDFLKARKAEEEAS